MAVGASSSLKRLGTRVRDSIRAFHYSLGKPFRWTYTGRPGVTRGSILPLQTSFNLETAVEIVMIEGHRGGRDLSFHRACLGYLLLDQRLGPLQLAGVAGGLRSGPG